MWGIRAPLWLIPAGVMSALAVALFAGAHAVFPPVSWTALGITVGLFTAMLVVAGIMPLGFRRATVFAWLLVTITIVSVASALALAVIDSVP